MKFADLHVHTTYSDGTSLPEELLQQAKKENLAAIAVCDHDTVGGIAECLKAGEKAGLEVLPGIELTSEYDGSEIHLLGYLIDYRNPALNDKLRFLQEHRVKRVYKIVEKLKQMGLTLNPESVFAFAKNGTVGRLHIARAMLKDKLVSTLQEAFGKFIGDSCQAYVCGFRISPEEAIKLLKDAGGVAVLAHPYSIHRDEIIPLLVEAGLQGLEAYYPEHTQGTTNFYLDMARRHNLLVTGGSDYHGLAKPGVKIGAVRVPYVLVEKIKEARENR